MGHAEALGTIVLPLVGPWRTVDHLVLPHRRLVTLAERSYSDGTGKTARRRSKIALSGSRDAWPKTFDGLEIKYKGVLCSM